MILLLIVLVAAFNIISTLMMVVTDKTREIGILRAMGMPARSIRRMFFAQGLVIGVVGTGAGLVVGLAAAIVDRPQQAHRSRPDHIFHRSSAGRDAAVRRDADRRREPRGGRAGDGLSRVAGGALVSRRGDPTRMMVLEAVELAKEYRGGDGGTITVLDGVNLRSRPRRDGGRRRRERRGEEHAAAPARRARRADARASVARSAGRTDSTGPRRDDAACRRFGTGQSGSCFSSITCCGSSRRWRT